MMHYLKQTAPKNRVSADILTLVDFSKGLAIVWIFLVHFRLLEIGWQGVHLFIIFSGLTLTYSCLKRGDRPDWRRWYVKRLRRILPTYWAVVFFGYLVVACLITWQGHPFLQSLWLAKQTLFFDLTLLKGFYHQAVSTFPNVSLWFVPFILSFYLFFPVLYKWVKFCKTPLHLLLFLAGTIGIEFAYRAIAIYWLDGQPIAYESLAIGLPFDRISDSFPFQLSAPFAFFPSRIGEFALGAIAGLLLLHHNHQTNRAILNWRTGVFGFLLWLAANYVKDTGFWGWIIADVLITLGLVLWVLNLALFVRKTVPNLFSILSKVGVNSYYIFLIHAIFIQVLFSFLDENDSMYAPFNHPVLSVFSFLCISLLTLMGSNALKKIDQSRFADWIVNHSIRKVLNA